MISLFFFSNFRKQFYDFNKIFFMLKDSNIFIKLKRKILRVLTKQ